MPRIILVLLMGGVIAAWWWQVSSPVSVVKPPPTAAPVIQAPDLAMLAARLNGGGVAPTPEQLAEDQQLVTEQVEYAIQQLHAADIPTRIEGAEQLSAYLTPEAERHLLITLAKDAAPEVRLAAVHSLMHVAKPTAATLDGLLAVLSDRSPEIPGAVLMVLENRLRHLESGAAEYRRIVAGLRQRLSTRSLSAATRKDIQQLLSDL